MPPISTVALWLLGAGGIRIVLLLRSRWSISVVTGAGAQNFNAWIFITLMSESWSAIDS